MNVLAFGILISETHVSTGNGIPVEFDIYIENTQKRQESVKLYFLTFFVFEEKYVFFVYKFCVSQIKNVGISFESLNRVKPLTNQQLFLTCIAYEAISFYYR